MGYYGVDWQHTDNWYATCPACDTTFGREAVPCVNCGKPELVYLLELHQTTEYTFGKEVKVKLYPKVSLRCLKEGLPHYAILDCPNPACDASVPMFCIKAHLAKRYHFLRPLCGLAAAFLAAGLFANLFSFVSSERGKQNATAAALVVGISAYLLVAGHVRLYFGRAWQRYSNE